MLILYSAHLEDADDRRLFEDIYYSYRKQMVTLAFSILGNHEDAEDAVSKVFLRIAERSWGTVRSIRSHRELRSYLLKATKNTALNMLKARRPIAIRPAPLQSHQDALSDEQFLELVCNRMEAQRVAQAIGQLEEKYRDALYYHFLLEMTISETAQALGQSYGTTQQQLYRGKKMLLTLLEQKGEDDHEPGGF